MYAIRSYYVSRKLIGSFLAIVVIMIIVGIVGYSGVSTTNNYLSQMYEQQLIPTDILEQTQGELWQIRGNPAGYLAIVSTRDSSRAEGTQLMKAIDTNLSAYEPYISYNFV